MHAENNEGEELCAEETRGPSCFAFLGPTSLAPFDIYRVLGSNWHVDARIFQRYEEFVVVYSMGHLISIMNLESNESESICTHEKNIVQIDQDLKGRFMVTCDQQSLIIWGLQCSEQEPQTILRVFHKPFGDKVIISAAMSSYGRYVIYVSEPDKTGNYQIHFWLWSFGRKKSIATISRQYGEIKNIRFSHGEEEEAFFMITMSHTVAFGLWDMEHATLKFHITDTKRFNELKSSCYVNNTRFAVSASSRGRLIVWSDLHFEIFNKPASNKKNFVKAVPLRNCSINDVRMIDEFITTVDECGEIRFYDTEIRLIYFCSWKLPAISSIYPFPVRRRYRLVDVEPPDYNEDASEEIIYASSCPKDVTLEGNPFIVRNFIVHTKDGRIFLCDVVKNTAKSLLYHCDALLVAADHHPSKSLIAACTASGNISYFDYIGYKNVASYNLNDIARIGGTSGQTPVCTSMKISPCGSFMAVGYNNGTLCLVDPTTGKHINLKPVCYTRHPVKLIVFERNSKYFAFTDSNFGIVFVHYVEKTWEVVGKYRYHCQPIVGAFFVKCRENTKLVTVGEDRILVEYDIRKSINRKEMIPIRDVRLEQSAKITAAILLPTTVLDKEPTEESEVILIANSEYKLKIFDIHSLECLLTVLGPMFESPIRQIIFSASGEFSPNPILVVASKKMLGTVLSPLDGNPFRCSGIIVHHEKINHISSARNEIHIFLQGEGDYGGSVWKINTKNVFDYFKSGGEGLIPFCSLLPGGKDGWLFKEMQDFFYYIQLISSSVDAPEEYTIRETINITEMVDYMRAIGYFPSEWEVKNMLTELTKALGSASIAPSKISFTDAVKLYLNHKPVDGYKLKDIIRAITHVTKTPPVGHSEEDMHGEQRSIEISLEQILDLLTGKAEAIPKEEAIKYLLELLEPPQKLRQEQEEGLPVVLENEIVRLPNIFNILDFCKLLLGVEVTLDDADHVFSVFGDVVDPSLIEPQLENKPQYTLPIDKCFRSNEKKKRDYYSEEEDEEEEEEGEGNIESEEISSSSLFS